MKTPLARLAPLIRLSHPGWFCLESRRQPATRSLLVVLLTATISSAQEVGRIDFRNFISGQLDVPVYEADGITKLEGDRYTANLTVSCCPFTDNPPTNIVNGIAASPFQTGDLAGYWRPAIAHVPLSGPADRVWAQLRILDQPPGLDGRPLLVRAMTEPFAIQLDTAPVPLPLSSNITLSEFPAVIDFRNRIPGVLDVPIYESDGVTRLAGYLYWVRIYVDLNAFKESGPTALEPIGTSSFEEGDLAGSWVPKRFAVHGRWRDGFPGQRIWAQIRIFDHSGEVQRGASEPFRLDLEPSTTLSGLKSFSLGNPPPKLDFRNYVEGLLDAPVYRADGTTRLSGVTGSMAQLLVGIDQDSLIPTGWPLSFGTGESAGYVGGPNPVAVVVPFARTGDRVWIQIRVWEPYPGGHIPEVFPPSRFTGESEIFSLVLSNTLTPLVGLKPFRLKPASIAATRQGDQLVLRWSAGDGTVQYDLEEASALGQSVGWRRSSFIPKLDMQHFEWSWVADWVVTNTVSGPATFYRIRLLNP